MKLFVRPVKWKTRREKKKALALGSLGREAAEAAEKMRWTLKIVEILIESAAPVCQSADLAQDPEAALRCVVGKKRSRTLRNRYRVWNRIRLWLTIVHEVPWPRHVGQMLDYLRDLELGQCGKRWRLRFLSPCLFFRKLRALPTLTRSV